MKTEMLDALNDDELRTVIARSQELLKVHDRERKDNALAQARSLLSSVGLSLKAVAGKSAKRSAAYRSGHHYQHPTRRELVWNAKGQKPNWLRALEREGGRAIELASGFANQNAAMPLREQE